jgi:pimeloyl-ACP methyl ester carboxylesterase
VTADVRPITLSTAGLRFGALAAGKASDPLVILLHGFPDSPSTFRLQFELLVDAGYRVIAPTLRGYEESSQPSDGDYSLTTVADDVVGWLDHLGVEQAHLVGHDWGAVITYVAAARHPDRFTTATALAIPPITRIPSALPQVPRQLLRSWYMTFFQLPWVSERALRGQDWWLMRRLWRSWSPAHVLSATDWEDLRTQFERPGVVSASLEYYRQNATPAVFLGLASTPAMELTEIPVPTLVIHGSDDGCMDRRLFEPAIKTQDFPAGIRAIEVENAGHFVQLEQPERVASAILEHLAG